MKTNHSVFSSRHHGNKVSFPHYRDLWMVYELISWLTKTGTMATNVLLHILLAASPLHKKWSDLAHDSHQLKDLFIHAFFCNYPVQIHDTKYTHWFTSFNRQGSKPANTCQLPSVSKIQKSYKVRGAASKPICVKQERKYLPHMPINRVLC